MGTKRLVIVLSDIEISTGDKYDDCPHTEYLYDFITSYNHPQYENQELDLVFNGDTFDFLKTQIQGESPHIIDENVALQKLEIVEEAHGQFFKAIEEFVNFGNRSRRVHFIIGNHDPEILFPKVQNKIISLCGGSGQISFPGFELKIGDLHIEHGNQHDSLFMMDPKRPFLEHKGRKILNLPWATVTLLNAIMPHRSDFYDLDRIKPRNLIFEIIPNLKEFILSTLWNYWTKDFLKDYLRTNDPLKKVSWNMLKVAMKRSLFFNPDVEISEYFYNQISHHEDTRVYVVGHMHNTHVLSYGNRKVLQSGCFRDEFMLGPDRKSYTPIPKSFVEVELVGNEVQTSNLKEVMGPEIPLENYPRQLEDIKPIIEEKLGTAEERLKDKLEIEAHEMKEDD